MLSAWPKMCFPIYNPHPDLSSQYFPNSECSQPILFLSPHGQFTHPSHKVHLPSPPPAPPGIMSLSFDPTQLPVWGDIRTGTIFKCVDKYGIKEAPLPCWGRCLQRTPPEMASIVKQCKDSNAERKKNSIMQTQGKGWAKAERRSGSEAQNSGWRDHQ